MRRRIAPFGSTLIRKHHSAFTRQVEESILINKFTRDLNLNSKAEWNGESIPRLTIEVNNIVKQVDHNGETIVSGKRPTSHKTKEGQGRRKRMRMTPAKKGEPTNKPTAKKEDQVPDQSPECDQHKVMYTEAPHKAETQPSCTSNVNKIK